MHPSLTLPITRLFLPCSVKRTQQSGNHSLSHGEREQTQQLSSCRVVLVTMLVLLPIGIHSRPLLGQERPKNVDMKLLLRFAVLAGGPAKSVPRCVDSLAPASPLPPALAGGVGSGAGTTAAGKDLKVPKDFSSGSAPYPSVSSNK
jgi:hypothetical protein